MVKKYTSKTKFNIVMETIKNGSVVEVARRHGISHGMLSNWRRYFSETAPQVFETTTDKEITNLNNKVKDLERMLGKKEVEVNLLKNFSDFYQSQNMS